MTPEGMLALCTTIIDDWMCNRVKPETSLPKRYEIINDFIQSMEEALKHNVSEDYFKQH